VSLRVSNLSGAMQQSAVDTFTSHNISTGLADGEGLIVKKIELILDAGQVSIWPVAPNVSFRFGFSSSPQWGPEPVSIDDKQCVFSAGSVGQGFPPVRFEWLPPAGIAGYLVGTKSMSIAVHSTNTGQDNIVNFRIYYVKTALSQLEALQIALM